jgi:hypothetical protein
VHRPQLLTAAASVYIYRDFLSLAECEHLLNISWPWVRLKVFWFLPGQISAN